MKIAILGTGSVGSSLGKLLHSRGHKIVFGSRTPKANLESKLWQNVDVRSVLEAIAESEIVFIATPWANEVTLDMLRNVNSFGSKVIVDCTNPLAPDYMSNLIGHTTSSAEIIAQLVAPAPVVKAFNTIFADIMAADKQSFNGVRSTGFYCGDDASAKAIVKNLIADCGFDPVDAGALKNSRYLEPMAQLNIQIAFGIGGGTDVAFRYMRRNAQENRIT
jgi:8-hydroxy-5-deazaflavin:NADPH oxidoreductase